MTKEKLEIYINALQRVLDESDKKWNDDQVPDASQLSVFYKVQLKELLQTLNWKLTNETRRQSKIHILLRCLDVGVV
jgi:hypothetical protein